MKILGQSMAKATVDKFEDKGFYGVRYEANFVFAAISSAAIRRDICREWSRRRLRP